MSLAVPYPAELLRVARKMVWFDKPEQTLADLKTFLAHLMVYGSMADIAVVKRYVPGLQGHFVPIGVRGLPSRADRMSGLQTTDPRFPLNSGRFSP